jgi:hypothetical protein
MQHDGHDRHVAVELAGPRHVVDYCPMRTDSDGTRHESDDDAGTVS